LKFVFRFVKSRSYQKNKENIIDFYPGRYFHADRAVFYDQQQMGAEQGGGACRRDVVGKAG
jgi:hypothetical protein